MILNYNGINFIPVGEVLLIAIILFIVGIIVGALSAFDFKQNELNNFPDS